MASTRSLLGGGQWGGLGVCAASEEAQAIRKNAWDAGASRKLVKSKLWARSRTRLFSNSLRWEQGWKKAREGSPGSLDWDWKFGRSLGQEVSYREVSLVDP